MQAVIRRLDLDADAKLNMREFIDGVRPIENFTAMQTSNKKSAGKRQRPATASLYGGNQQSLTPSGQATRPAGLGELSYVGRNQDSYARPYTR